MRSTSNSSVATAASSLWPADGGFIDRVDKQVSQPIFRLGFGRHAELLLSFPGCFFGMPAFMALSTPIVAMSVDPEAARLDGPAMAVFCVLCVFLAGVWTCVTTGRNVAWAPPLYSSKTVFAAPLLGTLLTRAITESPCSRSAANFHLLAWFTAIILVLQLKRLSSRRRPSVCAAEVEAAVKHKSLPALLRLFSRDGNGSFPSGDVTGAVCFAFPIWTGTAFRTTTRLSSSFLLFPLSSTTSALASICVILSALGRVYWLAHHVLDVVVAAVVAIAVNASLHTGLADESGRCTITAVWAPLLPLAALLVQMKLLPSAQKLLKHGTRRQ
uniref:Phosphatidic acid phosphatase type 2/haloperoxidase domain-containing protein n=2 Tax=Chrysotila carterae TaxID=13221 RepID=A0A7S4F3E6_CHRCT